MSFVIAIDGPAAAGKGTISKAVAAHFGFAHLDTGLLYRAVGAKVLAGGDAVACAQALQPDDLENDALRTPAVAQAASQIAVDPAVRDALVAFQRRFAVTGAGAVLDGRDIGTVICPDADVKIFVTAGAEQRAQRRFDELRAKDMQITLEQVLADVKARDDRDRNRDTAPLVPAADAILLDTSDLDIAAAVARAIEIIVGKLP